jgi:hypothetical protein
MKTKGATLAVLLMSSGAVVAQPERKGVRYPLIEQQYGSAAALLMMVAMAPGILGRIAIVEGHASRSAGCWGAR